MQYLCIFTAEVAPDPRKHVSDLSLEVVHLHSRTYPSPSAGALRKENTPLLMVWTTGIPLPKPTVPKPTSPETNVMWNCRTQKTDSAQKNCRLPTRNYRHQQGRTTIDEFFTHKFNNILNTDVVHLSNVVPSPPRLQPTENRRLLQQPELE